MVISDDRKDIVTVSAMMKAYCSMESYEDCIRLFKSLRKGVIHKELVPDVVAFGIVLNACTQSTAYYYGREVHSELIGIENGRMFEEVSIQIQLIKMYSKWTLTIISALLTNRKPSKSIFSSRESSNAPNNRKCRCLR